jgi:hypothetical protein
MVFTLHVHIVDMWSVIQPATMLTQLPIEHVVSEFWPPALQSRSFRTVEELVQSETIRISGPMLDYLMEQQLSWLLSSQLYNDSQCREK